MAIKKRKKSKNKIDKVEKNSRPPTSDESSSQEASEKETVKEVKEKPQEQPVKSDPKKGSTMKSKETKSEGTGIAGYIQFLKEVRIEYKKINWPDRRQIIQETWTVIILVTFITLLVLAYDWVLGNVVFGPLEHWIKLNL